MATQSMTDVQSATRLPSFYVPRKQTQLLLHAVKQPYEVTAARDVPELKAGELLVRVEAIGLNPIDWKSAYDIKYHYSTYADSYQ
jgi:hypothetical protein